MAELHHVGLMPMAALFACNQPACMDERFYASTWALMTFLLNEHPAELMKYMERLAQTPEAEQAQLWAEVFPALPPSKLDHELASWLRYGRHTVMKYNIALRSWTVTEAPIREADVLAAKGVLRYFDAPQGPVPKEITQAAALDPTNVIANMVASVVNKSFSNETARAVTSAHPDDWRAWWIAWRTSTTVRVSRGEGQDVQPARPECRLGSDTGVRDGASRTDRPGPALSGLRRSDAAGQRVPEEVEASRSGLRDQSRDRGLRCRHKRACIGRRARVNACVEALMKTLTFPPHHAGPYHLSTNHH